MFSSLYIAGWTEAPHGGCKDNASEAFVATEFAKHAQILQTSATEADVNDPVNIDAPCQCEIALMGLVELICDLPENFGVGAVGVIEAGSVDQIELLARWQCTRDYFDLSGT